MDAIKFIKTLQRKIKNENRDEIIIRVTEDAGLLVDFTEEWSNEHPAKTRQSVFLNQYPNASVIEGSGTIGICPRALDKDYECFYQHSDDTDVKIVDCLECKKQFWMQEVE